MTRIDELMAYEVEKAKTIAAKVAQLRELCATSATVDIAAAARNVIPALCCVVECAQFLLDHDRLGVPGTRVLAGAMEAFGNVTLD